MAQAVFTAGRARDWSAPRWRPRRRRCSPSRCSRPRSSSSRCSPIGRSCRCCGSRCTARSASAAPQAYVGLDNFLKLFADTAFRKALANNLVYAFGTVIPSLVLALGFAMALAKSSRVNALFRALFFLPVLIPLVAAASIFLFLFLPNVGLIDYHLAKLAISGPNWLGDPDIAL